MKAQAIIPTAGLGKRFGTSTLKSLLMFNGKPLFVVTCAAFEASSLIDGIVLVCPPDYQKRFESLIRKHRLKKVRAIVLGGRDRYHSVKNGLAVIDATTDIVAVHDGARPLVTPDLIDESIRQARRYTAVVVGVPVKQTIKKVSGPKRTVQATLKRDEFWEIQTPQAFKADILKRAYGQKLSPSFTPTDDASLVEALGIPVRVIEGSYRNIKITTREDLVIAQALVSSRF